ncbi:hypothetical protein [Methylobacterium sp. sgz302541]|uniref:hypothetical protein n=1 Tax=unclassified Methylobacterium TaxID=2615210 RepID=UPI003D356DD7
MPADDAQDRRVLAVSRAMDEAAQPSALLLACGEMTAQEMCTAKAVAHLMTRVALDALHAPATPDDREAERVRAVEEMRERAMRVCELISTTYANRIGTPEERTGVDGECSLAVARAEDAIRALPIPEGARPAEDGLKPPRVEFHQHDWIPGFAAFAPGATTPGPDSRAFCVLNLGSILGTVETGDVPPTDLPYFIAESMMHEVMHALEQWAGTEFSEERVEALLAKYRALSTGPGGGDAST